LRALGAGGSNLGAPDLSKIGAKNLGVADRGIREGILRSLMARDGHQL